MAVTRFSANDAATAKWAGGKIKPVNIIAPVISGSLGGTLTVSDGVWINSPTGFTYRWQVNGNNIPGATTNTLDSSPYAGFPISAHVIATNADGSTISCTAPLPIGGLVPPAGYAFVYFITPQGTLQIVQDRALDGTMANRLRSVAA